MGGTCFGDSGRTAFYDSTTTIVAIRSYGTNGNCPRLDGISGSTSQTYSPGSRASSTPKRPVGVGGLSPTPTLFEECQSRVTTVQSVT
jgi:hypothetical protein